MLALVWSLAAGRTLPNAGGSSSTLQRRPLQTPTSAFEPCDPEDNEEDCECETKDNEISCARVRTADDGTSSSAGASASASGSGPVASSASITITGSGGTADSSTFTPGGGTDASAEQRPAPPPPSTKSTPEEPPPKEPPPKSQPVRRRPVVKPRPKKTPIKRPSFKRPSEEPEGYEDLTKRCFVEPDDEQETFARELAVEGVKVTLLRYLGDGLYKADTFYQVAGTIGSKTIITTRLPEDVAALCGIDDVEDEESSSHVTITHSSRFTSSSTEPSERRSPFFSRSKTTITSGGITTIINTRPANPAKGL